jgi:hypothetical protein
MVAKPRTMATVLHITARHVRPQQLLHITGFADETPTHILPAMDSPLTRRTDAPERSADQRREALARANQVRMQRAELKAQLKRGELSICSLITEPPHYLASARIKELLLACPGYGRVKVERLLTRCEVSPRRTIAGLSDRQRRELIRALDR